MNACAFSRAFIGLRSVAHRPVARVLPKDDTGRIRFTDHIIGNGEGLFEKLEALKLEGMVMKRKDSVYSFAPCRDWLKVKTVAGRMTMQKRSETWR